MVDLNGLQVLYRFYMASDVTEYGMKHRLVSKHLHRHKAVY
jgi:hypothetical protein